MYGFTIKLREGLDLEKAHEALEHLGVQHIFSIADEKQELIGGYLPQIVETDLAWLGELSLLDLQIDWAEQWGLEQGKVKKVFFGETHLDLHPGEAFGDLSHETTYLMLELMQGQMLGKRVLDLGCGSGILACFALKWGALFAYCIDCAPESIKLTQTNLLENQQAPFSYKVEVAIDWEKEPVCDICLCNMIQEDQKVAVKQNKQAFQQAQQLLFSGILVKESESYQRFLFEEILDPDLWQLDRILEKGIWQALELKKKPSFT